MKKIVFVIVFAFMLVAFVSFADDSGKTDADIKLEHITDKRIIQKPINNDPKKQSNRSSELSTAQKMSQGLKSSSENAMGTAGAITGLGLSGGSVGAEIDDGDDDNKGM